MSSNMWYDFKHIAAPVVSSLFVFIKWCETFSYMPIDSLVVWKIAEEGRFLSPGGLYRTLSPSRKGRVVNDNTTQASNKWVQPLSPRIYCDKFCLSWGTTACAALYWITPHFTAECEEEIGEVCDSAPQGPRGSYGEEGQGWAAGAQERGFQGRSRSAGILGQA